MNKKSIAIRKTKEFVQKKMQGESTGHDWFHIERVLKLSINIAMKEKNADIFIVQLAALLHDIADWKFHNGDDSIGIKIAFEWLEKLQINNKDIDHVCRIIKYISFKGGINQTKMKSLEGKIVQDADRLDALGAIGIARTFAFGGYIGREIYNPGIKPQRYTSMDQVKKGLKTNTTINHFYEKLLLLKEQMNTQTAKDIAEKRHKFTEEFLVRFNNEWNGED